MPTIKQTILQELLDSASNPERLDSIFDAHKKSKGPLYLALAEATQTLRQRFEEGSKDLNQQQLKVDKLGSDNNALESQRRTLQESIQALQTEHSRNEDRLADSKENLSLIERLRELGFGESQLSRLHEIISEIGADLPPGETVTTILEIVKNHRDLASLDMATKAAKKRQQTAETEAIHLETEVKALESKAKRKKSSIDSVARMNNKGVTESMLLEWEKVIDKSGMSIESLSEELMTYGSLKSATIQQSIHLNQTVAKVNRAKSRLATLENQEASVKETIAILQCTAMKASQTARSELANLREEIRCYADLVRESVKLREEVEVARFLKEGSVEEWQYMSKDMAQSLIMGLIFWSQPNHRNVLVEPPPQMRKANQSLLKFNMIRLSDLLIWALNGTLEDAQVKAAVCG